MKNQTEKQISVSWADRPPEMRWKCHSRPKAEIHLYEHSPVYEWSYIAASKVSNLWDKKIRFNAIKKVHTNSIYFLLKLSSIARQKIVSTSFVGIFDWLLCRCRELRLPLNSAYDTVSLRLTPKFFPESGQCRGACLLRIRHTSHLNLFLPRQ